MATPEASQTEVSFRRVLWMVCGHLWCHTGWCVDNTGVSGVKTGVWTPLGSPCLGYGHPQGHTDYDLVSSGFTQAPLGTHSVTKSGVWTRLGSQTRPRPVLKMHKLGSRRYCGQMAAAWIPLDYRGLGRGHLCGRAACGVHSAGIVLTGGEMPLETQRRGWAPWSHRLWRGSSPGHTGWKIVSPVVTDTGVWRILRSHRLSCWHFWTHTDWGVDSPGVTRAGQWRFLVVRH